MHRALRNLAAGMASAMLTCVATVCMLGYTSALAMPRGFPLALWEITVVFGLGAGLVAFLIHMAALRVLSAQALPALLAFAATSFSAMVMTGQLSLGYKALIAWLLGALLASVAHNWRRSHHSSEPASRVGV